MRRNFFISLLFLIIAAALAISAGKAQAYPGQQSPEQYQAATPQPDGSIVHEVREGESIWTIAELYDMSADDLIALNALPLQPTIFAGQKLLIRVAPTPTITPTITKTPRPPTRTPAPTNTARPPTMTPTITATPTPLPFSVFDLFPGGETQGRRYLGIGLIVVCALGLVWVTVASIRK